MNIKKIYALEILDSRGNPTVEAHVITESGFHGFGKVPSGASTGAGEALELRDGDMRYNGKGVLKAVNIINTEIEKRLLGVSVNKQNLIDKMLLDLDGTEDKSNLGANAMLAVSIACTRAAANAYNVELYEYLGGFTADLLPLPMMNIVNGGVHAGNNLDIQEFMIVPVGATYFSDGIRMCAEIYQTLKRQLKNNNLSVSVGDEGGFAPDFNSHEEAIESILKAIDSAGYKIGEDVKIALDAAASEWFDGRDYRMPKSKHIYSRESLVRYWEKLANDYPIISMEDPAAENDWETWHEITKKLKLQVVGDDLFVTHTSLLEKGISEKSANAILIKPNQVGTVTETIEAIKLAKSVGFGTIISHRSGDTEDDFISDLAVGLGAGQIKTGAPCRSERNAKYNRLLYIENKIRNNI